MKRIVIIDDELPARQSLRSMLTTYCPDVEIVGEADGVASGVRLIRQERPHAVLLDILMEDGSGFDLLDLFPQLDFKVIFTTAFDQWALRAFRYSALDYLLKPISPKELITAINRIAEVPLAEYTLKLRNLMEETRQNQLTKMILRSQEGLIVLHLDNIVFLQSEGNYTTFFILNKEQHVSTQPIKVFEELLPEPNFFRIHQSYIVNRAFIKKILKEDGGSVLVESGNKLPLALRRKNEFLAWFINDFTL